MTTNQADLSKTVYSLVWPETRALMLKCFQQEAETMISRHDLPHEKRQDVFGPDFARAWWSWAGVSQDQADVWPYFYPTNGASEALREIINELGKNQGTLIVFTGEYEGYQAIASGAGVSVVCIDRRNWREEWSLLAPKLKTRAQFWISNPSSLDGCFWDDFDEFCQTVSHPLLELWVDLTYIGGTPSALHRTLPFITSENIAGVVFSLSKPAGMYYRRVGGCFSRRSISGLYGNQWFKNIDSIFLGQKFIESYPRGYLPDKYAHFQKKVIDDINQNVGLFHDYDANSFWTPSDVVLLAHSHSVPLSEQTEVDPERFRRAEGFYRVCLTPVLHKKIYEGGK